jgi:hypothetical protein
MSYKTCPMTYVVHVLNIEIVEHHNFIGTFVVYYY